MATPRTPTTAPYRKVTAEEVPDEEFTASVPTLLEMNSCWRQHQSQPSRQNTTPDLYPLFPAPAAVAPRDTDVPRLSLR